MPKNEIKNTFTGGRMNKDLDERLITTGEYRDAMNVQVTTSEGSDIGSLHNVMGNYDISHITGAGGVNFTSKATCIGSVVDEKNDKLYWLIEGLQTNYPIGTPPLGQTELYKADAIAEYDKSTNLVSPVVVDVYEVNATHLNISGHIIYPAGAPAPLNQIVVMNTSSHFSGGVLKKRIWPGMICTIKNTGFSVVDVLEVLSVDYVTGNIIFVRDVVDPDIVNSTKTNFGIHFKFQSPQRALNFTYEQVGLMKKHYLVTGINIIDKQLFWTDNNSEPKRIHIDRYRDFGTSTFDQHSWTPERNFAVSSVTYMNKYPLVESHITVIRQKPLSAPQLIMDNTTAEGVIEGDVENEDDGGQDINSIHDFKVGDTNWIDFASPVPDFQYGNIIILTSIDPTTNVKKTIRAKIGDPNNVGLGIWPGADAWACASGVAGCTAFMIEILRADPEAGPTDIDWFATLEEDPPLFEFKFPRFSTRYKYEDGEYSAFGPWSEVAFLPDRPGGADYEFVAFKGYNTGMTNQIRRLALHNFVPGKLLPVGVIGIDILYKESDSPNVYSLLTVKPNEIAWTTRMTYSGGNNSFVSTAINSSVQRGYLKIKSEMIHGILPENQLLRSYDNVPRKALAQEVSGNRLIYGNYLQNYDLLDAGNNIVIPGITIGLQARDTPPEDISPEQVFPHNTYKYAPSKSIKSLRTYQLGIAYIDKYGRETPVFTDNNDKKVSVTLDEWYSDKQVKITGQIASGKPSWAEYYKYFIKETSSEYYNLALDRWYDAEDGNVWLSFPSSERNKVDIDTYLILKKEHDANSPILEDARYDILAIENEAPDFIKTRRIPIGTAADDPNAPTPPGPNITFGTVAGTGFPIMNQMYVRVNDSEFDGAMLMEATGMKKDDLFIRFDVDNFFTDWYEVTHVELDAGSNPTTWLLNIAREFGEDINILTNDPVAPWVSKKSPITMHIMQEEIKNLPEFDGRFFVKVHSNALLKESVIKIDPNSTRYSVPTSYKVQYINASPDPSFVPAWDAWDTSSGGAYYGSGTISHLPEISSYDHNHYGNNWPSLTHNTGAHFWKQYSETNESQFFIDRVPFFRLENPPISSNEYIASHTPIGALPRMRHGGAPGWPGHSNWLQCPDPDSEGIINPHQIHLSLNGGDAYHFDTGLYHGSSTAISATHHHDQIKFISDLTTPGTLWRWAEDPDETVYITRGGSGNRVDGIFNIAGENWWAPAPDTYTDLGKAPLIHISILADYYSRNRWTIDAEALLTGGGFGSGPSGYRPDNPTDLNAHFANDGSLLTASTTPAKPSTNAPGIRQDGMGVGVQTSANAGGYIVPPVNKKVVDSGGNFVNTAKYIPGSVTWQILAPTQLTELKYSSHNPAIFETEPKENLDLEIYHEVGQTYPTEYNSETNELYIPIGSIVTCWRPSSTTFDINDFGATIVTAAQGTWDNSAGDYVVTGGSGTDDIPTQNINLGGAGSIWTPPIIVSAVGEDTVTLTDATGAAFNNSPGWPNEHALIGDYLLFVRPDGSATEAVFAGRDTAINSNYHIQQNISGRKQTLPWFNGYSFGNGVESNRIRDDYNQVTIDKGPKVSSTLEETYKEERKLNGLIYSGIYNSTSGINNLNEFIAAEKITKDLNPTYGSIQKLFQRRINLITFCEDRVVKVLSNKDALYNADGDTNLTATSRVLGDAQPYAGEYGISKNPESFASDAYRAYFVDKQRSAVLRLSRDGITAISDHGMIDWFRDNLHLPFSFGTSLSSRLMGSFDVTKREYNITLTDHTYGMMFLGGAPGFTSQGYTLSFREDVKGWVSFKSYIPEDGISLAGKYYTFRIGNIWEHHSTLVNYNTFYNIHTPSHVTTIFNTDPKSVKNFETLNYEGTQTRVDRLIEYVNPRDGILYTDSDYHNLEPNKPGWYVSDIHTDMQDGTLKEFIEKEGKWFNYIRGKEIVASASGLIGGAGFDYDPNEFSWQGIGEGGTSTSQAVGGCTDLNAANGGCSSVLNPGQIQSPPVYPSAPCIGSSPDINGICADGSSCSQPGCCGPGNGWQPIDFNDGSCDMAGVVYGCKNFPGSPNHDCETALYPPTPSPPNYLGNPCMAPYNACPCTDGVTHDNGTCYGVSGCTDATNLLFYDPNATQDCNNAWISPHDPNYVPSFGWDSCCDPMVPGCNDSTQFNHDPNANWPCDANAATGCMTTSYTHPLFGSLSPCSGNWGYSTSPGLCCDPIVYGCMDPLAGNYYISANIPSGTTGSGSTCCYSQTTNLMQTIISNPLGCDCMYAEYGCHPSPLTTIAGGHPDVNGYGSDANYSTTPCSTQFMNVPTNAGSISTCTFGNCTDGYLVDNFDPYAIDDGSCTGIDGCTDPLASNYNSFAYTDDNSCTYGCCGANVSVVEDATLGYVFDLQFNSALCTVLAGGPDIYVLFYVKRAGLTWSHTFYLNATTTGVASGSQDETEISLTPNTSVATLFTGNTNLIDITNGGGGLANLPCGTCANATWTIDMAIDSLALPTCLVFPTVDVALGCTDSTACNYDPLANVDDGSCIMPDGCTDSTACNYDPTAQCDNGTCLTTYGCMDSLACGYNPLATCDDGSCDTNYGCTNPIYCNYDPLATCNDGTCLPSAGFSGCMDSTACNYDSNAACNNGYTPSCILPDGCTNPLACNYDPAALCDNGSCLTDYGCMDSSACNHDPLATCDDGGCLYGALGCTDPNSCNYNSNAACGDDSCAYCDQSSGSLGNYYISSHSANPFNNFSGSNTPSCNTHCRVCGGPGGGQGATTWSVFPLFGQVPTQILSYYNPGGGPLHGIQVEWVTPSGAFTAPITEYTLEYREIVPPTVITPPWIQVVTSATPAAPGGIPNLYIIAPVAIGTLVAPIEYEVRLSFLCTVDTTSSLVATHGGSHSTNGITQVISLPL